MAILSRRKMSSRGRQHVITGPDPVMFSGTVPREMTGSTAGHDGIRVGYNTQTLWRLIICALGATAPGLPDGLC
ncbi:MAG: hypothetical protein ABSA58_26355, partial [Acetobacteraceae bacterium]